MEVEEYINNLAFLEERIILCKDLLDVTKSYCENNFEKADELSVIGSVLTLMQKEYNELSSIIDALYKQYYLCKR